MVHFVMYFTPIIASIKKYRRFWLLISFWILFTFAAIRYNFGNDYRGYYYNYTIIHSGGKPYTSEPIFLFLIKLCPNFYTFIAVTSIITVIPVYYLIKHYVDIRYCWLSVLIYCINPYLFLMSLSAIRQTLALSFFIIAVHYSLRHKLIPYLIFVALAAMCHITAIVLLPFYIIANDRKVSRTQVVALMVCLAILTLSKDLFSFLLRYGLNLFDNPNYKYYATFGGNTLRATLLSSVYLVYIAMNIPRLSGTTLAFSKLSVIGYVFSILAFQISMFTRLQIYFDVFSIISIPMIMEHNNITFKSGSKIYYIINKYALPMLIFTIYILRYYSFFTNPLWEHFRVYHTIFGSL